MSEPTLAIRSVELLEVALPLVRPFRTSFGEEREKRAILVEALCDDDVIGWGECVTSPEPRYSEEWLDGAWVALAEHLVPSVLAGGPILEAVGPPEAPEPVIADEPVPRRGFVSIPRDHLALRTRDPALGGRWRDAAADAFERCFAAGLVATRIISDARYLFERAGELP